MYRREYARAFEWELLEARDTANHGISITSRPNEKCVMWERKSRLEYEADRFLRSHGVGGLRIANERRHDCTKGASILSDRDRREIVAARLAGATKISLAKKYGVSERLIYNVMKAHASDAVDPHA